MQEQNKKEWARSVGLVQKHKPQHPNNVEVSPRGPVGRRVQDAVKCRSYGLLHAAASWVFGPSGTRTRSTCLVTGCTEKRTLIKFSQKNQWGILKGKSLSSKFYLISSICFQRVSSLKEKHDFFFF